MRFPTGGVRRGETRNNPPPRKGGPTYAMSTITDTSSARRTELILREIDSLPTLPAIATRLLTLTTSDESSAAEVIDLIRTDPALTAKVLSLCRKASRGVSSDAMTVDKAVVLLGFDTIRMAVLSIKVFEVFDQAKAAADGSRRDNGNGAGRAPDQPRFDRNNFWRHCLAVGIACELIAGAHHGYGELEKSEAFVCGLMHDLGKLALDYVLPQAYSRVVELTELNQGNIAEMERKILGLDHHTAGKRLAEQWDLPAPIQDCMWLHGSRYETLPRLGHRKLIGVVGLADLVVRRQHIGYSGNFSFDQDVSDVAITIGLDSEKVESITLKLHDELQRRISMLELEEEPSAQLFLESIQRANLALGRLTTNLDRRSRLAARQATILDAISSFQSTGGTARSLRDTLDAVVASAHQVLGVGYYAMLLQPDDRVPSNGPAWLICHYNEQGEPTHSELVDPPPHSPDLSGLDAGHPVTLRLVGLLPWITSHLSEAPDIQQVQLMPLRGQDHTAAVLLHDRNAIPAGRELTALLSCWGAAISNSASQEATRRLGEDLADANRALAEAQDQLLRTESMARLGEMAAGAAHEMNNPLAVISGRAQLLSKTLKHGTKPQETAQTIVDQSHRLTDLITSLRMFADPPRASRRATDLGSLLNDAVRLVTSETAQPGTEGVPISLKVQTPMPPVPIDPEQVGAAVRELLLNAVQANPKTGVHVSARVEPTTQSLIIQVIDDGQGMDAHTLDHAMDPFFSSKPAGRQVGMGLARASQLVGAHRGRLDLRSAQGDGTTATLTVPLDSLL